jgi:hypothetical protein
LVDPRSELIAWRGRNVPSVGHRSVSRANHNLSITDRPDVAVLPWSSENKGSLKLADEPRRDRSSRDPIKSLFGRGNVVQDLPDLQRPGRTLLKLGLQDLLERRERALEGTGALGLPANRGLAQEPRLRNLLTGLVQTPQGALGARNDRPSLGRQGSVIGQRIRQVRVMLVFTS